MLTDFITFTPETIEIRKWIDTTEEGQPFSMENMKEVSEFIEDPDEIRTILQKLEEIYVYADGTSVPVIGEYTFTVILSDEENEVIFTELGSVTVSINGEETDYTYRDTQKAYLTDLFESK